MVVLVLFFVGLFFGSFFGVLIDRLSNGKSIWKGRSHCDHCKKTLAWYDLIPLLSFVMIKGKCRYCKAKLALYYPIVECVTGLLFVFTYFFVVQYYIPYTIYHIPLLLALLYSLFIASCFIILFFADIKYGILPDAVIFPAIVITFLYTIINHQSSIINHLFAGIGACLFFLLLFLVTKGKGMGFGDVKLSFLLGLFLGFPLVIAGLYMAFLTGAIIASILVICRKKKLIGSTIPFGPFLIVGSGIGLLWGAKLLQLFFNGVLH